MSNQRSRTDTLQQIMSTFKQFEKKLDKLQEDVNYHGHTLSELHVMLANISGGTILNHINDAKLDEAKRFVNKTTAMHYENNSNTKKVKRTDQQALLPKPKSLQMDKYGINGNSTNLRMSKTVSSPKHALLGKKLLRQRKGEAPRKVSLRKKEIDKRVKSNDMPF